MSIHHLPSIRVHDQPSSYESGFDNSPSVHSIRSQPRDIPFRHSSPTSIRGSYYPTDAPPPVLPLGPIHASEWDKRRDDDLDRHGTRSPMEWGSGNMGRGSMGSHKSSKGNWGSKRLDENMRETRHDFEKVAITERISKTLNEGSLRKEPGPRNPYDQDVIRKLTPGLSWNNQRNTFNAVDDGPVSLDNDSTRLPTRNFPSISSPIAIGVDPSKSLWGTPNSRLAKMALSPELHPPVFQPSMEYRNPDQLGSSFGPNEDSFSDRMRRGTSISMRSGDSCDDFRDRPLRSRKSDDRMDSDLQMDDIPSSKMGHLNLGSDTPPRPNSYPLQHNTLAGSKRRASSPPNGASTELRSPSGSQYSSRYSPAMSSKFHPLLGMHSASTGSSFASSAGTGWSNSLGASSLVSAASSFTTQDRHSPVASFSPSSDLDISMDSPHMSHASTSTQRASRSRTGSDLQMTSPDRDNLPQKIPPVSKLNGMYQCECCPKKPRKFEQLAELQAHESEKQFSCNFCPNRFKNKNEAERHQNSLHLRKHSWSCAALIGEEAAFHHSTQRPGFFDVCGYCGKEFPCPANLEVRREHLKTEHKFGECNQAKKFFRADHFRQHLKHSHSGTAGKWTNVLENACMRAMQDESNPVISEE